MELVIDAHHHLWKYNSADYSWIDNSMDKLKRDYLPADLEKEVKGSGIHGTVVIQARQTVEETGWLLKLASRYLIIKGIVGWVDLQSPGLINQLDKFAGHPKLAGMRHVIHDEPDVDFMLRPKFLKGIGLLQDYHLTYDLLLFPKHLPNAIKLVKMFPRMRFILDHMSKPPIKSGKIRPWKDGIEILAGESNVWCKVSGLVTEADHRGWNYKQLVPYLTVVLEAFGPDRIMVGSDWPVCTQIGRAHV